MTKEEMFKLGFRIAEAIYLKPGQVVKSEAEILKEMPMDANNETIVYEIWQSKNSDYEIPNVLRLGNND